MSLKTLARVALFAKKQLKRRNIEDANMLLRNSRIKFDEALLRYLMPAGELTKVYFCRRIPLLVPTPIYKCVYQTTPFKWKRSSAVWPGFRQRVLRVAYDEETPQATGMLQVPAGNTCKRHVKKKINMRFLSKVCNATFRNTCQKLVPFSRHFGTFPSNNSPKTTAYEMENGVVVTLETINENVFKVSYSDSDEELFFVLAKDEKNGPSYQILELADKQKVEEYTKSDVEADKSVKAPVTEENEVDDKTSSAGDTEPFSWSPDEPFKSENISEVAQERCGINILCEDLPTTTADNPTEIQERNFYVLISKNPDIEQHGVAGFERIQFESVDIQQPVAEENTTTDENVPASEKKKKNYDGKLDVSDIADKAEGLSVNEESPSHEVAAQTEPEPSEMQHFDEDSELLQQDIVTETVDVDILKENILEVIKDLTLLSKDSKPTPELIESHQQLEEPKNAADMNKAAEKLDDNSLIENLIEIFNEASESYLHKMTQKRELMKPDSTKLTEASAKRDKSIEFEEKADLTTKPKLVNAANQRDDDPSLASVKKSADKQTLAKATNVVKHQEKTQIGKSAKPATQPAKENVSAKLAKMQELLKQQVTQATETPTKEPTVSQHIPKTIESQATQHDKTMINVRCQSKVVESVNVQNDKDLPARNTTQQFVTDEVAATGTTLEKKQLKKRKRMRPLRVVTKHKGTTNAVKQPVSSETLSKRENNEAKSNESVNSAEYSKTEINSTKLNEIERHSIIKKNPKWTMILQRQQKNENISIKQKQQNQKINTVVTDTKTNEKSSVSKVMETQGPDCGQSQKSVKTADQSNTAGVESKKSSSAAVIGMSEQLSVKVVKARSDLQIGSHANPLPRPLVIDNVLPSRKKQSKSAVQDQKPSHAEQSQSVKLKPVMPSQPSQTADSHGLRDAQPMAQRSAKLAKPTLVLENQMRNNTTRVQHLSNEMRPFDRATARTTTGNAPRTADMRQQRVGQTFAQAKLDDDKSVRQPQIQVSDSKKPPISNANISQKMAAPAEIKTASMKPGTRQAPLMAFEVQQKLVSQPIAQVVNAKQHRNATAPVGQDMPQKQTAQTTAQGATGNPPNNALATESQQGDGSAQATTTKQLKNKTTLASNQNASQVEGAVADQTGTTPKPVGGQAANVTPSSSQTVLGVNEMQHKQVNRVDAQKGTVNPPKTATVPVGQNILEKQAAQIAAQAATGKHPDSAMATESKQQQVAEVTAQAPTTKQLKNESTLASTQTVSQVTEQLPTTHKLQFPDTVPYNARKSNFSNTANQKGSVVQKPVSTQATQPKKVNVAGAKSINVNLCSEVSTNDSEDTTAMNAQTTEQPVSFHMTPKMINDNTTVTYGRLQLSGVTNAMMARNVQLKCEQHTDAKPVERSSKAHNTVVVEKEHTKTEIKLQNHGKQQKCSNEELAQQKQQNVSRQAPNSTAGTAKPKAETAVCTAQGTPTPNELVDALGKQSNKEQSNAATSLVHKLETPNATSKHNEDTSMTKTKETQAKSKEAQQQDTASIACSSTAKSEDKPVPVSCTNDAITNEKEKPVAPRENPALPTNTSRLMTLMQANKQNAKPDAPEPPKENNAPSTKSSQNKTDTMPNKAAKGFPYSNNKATTTKSQELMGQMTKNANTRAGVRRDRKPVSNVKQIIFSYEDTLTLQTPEHRDIFAEATRAVKPRPQSQRIAYELYAAEVNEDRQTVESTEKVSQQKREQPTPVAKVGQDTVSKSANFSSKSANSDVQGLAKPNNRKYFCTQAAAQNSIGIRKLHITAVCHKAEEMHTLDHEQQLSTESGSSAAQAEIAKGSKLNEENCVPQQCNESLKQEQSKKNLPFHVNRPMHTTAAQEECSEIFEQPAQSCERPKEQETLSSHLNMLKLLATGATPASPLPQTNPPYQHRQNTGSSNATPTFLRRNSQVRQTDYKSTEEPLDSQYADTWNVASRESACVNYTRSLSAGNKVFRGGHVRKTQTPFTMPVKKFDEYIKEARAKVNETKRCVEKAKPITDTKTLLRELTSHLRADVKTKRKIVPLHTAIDCNIEKGLKENEEALEEAAEPVEQTEGVAGEIRMEGSMAPPVSDSSKLLHKGTTKLDQQTHSFSTMPSFSSSDADNQGESIENVGPAFEVSQEHNIGQTARKISMPKINAPILPHSVYRNKRLAAVALSACRIDADRRKSAMSRIGKERTGDYAEGAGWSNAATAGTKTLHIGHERHTAKPFNQQKMMPPSSAMPRIRKFTKGSHNMNPMRKSSNKNYSNADSKPENMLLDTSYLNLRKKPCDSLEQALIRLNALSSQISKVPSRKPNADEGTPPSPMNKADAEGLRYDRMYFNITPDGTEQQSENASGQPMRPASPSALATLGRGLQAAKQCGDLMAAKNPSPDS